MMDMPDKVTIGDGVFTASTQGATYIRQDIHEAEIAKLRNALDVAEKALEELYALVKGECPSLLSEDSGGDAQLDFDVQKALTTIKQARG